MGAITLWHGGRRWDGAPQIRPSSPGRYECGPGIYLTTEYATARKYALGGGYAMKAELHSGIRWLQGARLPLATLIDFVTEAPRLRARSRVLRDLRDAAASHRADAVPAEYLVNCCVNNDALAGDAGPTLAAWLVEHGIDASMHSPRPGEDWVVVFNPAVIGSMRPVSASQINPDERTFCTVAEQLSVQDGDEPGMPEGDGQRP